ncbi:phosphoribosylglycinamide formyltransferase [Pseudohalioglobus sediminis]|uniref:Phosphoribosylglycinamide formyltransferase n=1 Tax=Pseudohalioglobus sediminis TaxID=2606449 RepID=A0A5B0X0Q3_9GAMM|nr:phosphoribosylglycinamide formyltransferase [Pseudohalioglobus sediminis]KAA1192856.1 phosphoribosylglycinamide formyltransferase [Pseudohalioglobus sediminis]
MNAPATKRLAILISGRGSNMQAFIDACSSGVLDAEIALVLSNNPDAGGLARAAEAGIPTACINHRNYDSRETFDAAMVAELSRHDPDLVILAGFMRILTPVFIEPFAGKLLNIHPSLLPKYPGLNTHQRALDAGDSEAGVTVHFVTPELDGGPPIIQARVPVETGDTAATLAARVIVQEHVIYPIAAGWVLQGRLRLTDKGAVLDGQPLPPTGVDYVATHH